MKKKIEKFRSCSFEKRKEKLQRDERLSTWMRDTTAKKMSRTFISIKSLYVKWNFLIFSTKSSKAVCKKNVTKKFENLSSHCFHNHFDKNTLKSRFTKIQQLRIGIVIIWSVFPKFWEFSLKNLGNFFEENFSPKKNEKIKKGCP